MSDHVYKTVEVTGSSSESSDDAIRKAVAKASQSAAPARMVHGRGGARAPAGRRVAHWQVTVKIGFRLEDWT
jgi:flavin-binding protein dodecin